VNIEIHYKSSKYYIVKNLYNITLKKIKLNMTILMR